MRPKTMTWRESLRDWFHTNKPLVWWCLVVALVLLAGAVVLPGRLGGFLAGGLLLVVSAFLMARVVLEVNVWRTKQKLTWPSLLGGLLLVWVAWLVLTGPGDWARVRAALLMLGYYAVLIGAGLLVLYLVVRVVRVAWRTPANHGESRGTGDNLTSQAPAEVIQLILSPQEAWVLAGALATAVVPPTTEDAKGFRARLGIIGEMQDYARTEAGREMVARLAAKVLGLVEHVEQLKGNAPP